MMSSVLDMEEEEEEEDREYLGLEYTSEKLITNSYDHLSYPSTKKKSRFISLPSGLSLPLS